MTKRVTVDYVNLTNSANFFHRLPAALNNIDIEDLRLNYSENFGFKVYKKRTSYRPNYTKYEIKSFVNASNKLLQIINQRRSERNESEKERFIRYENSIRICNKIAEVAECIIHNTEDFHSIKKDKAWKVLVNLPKKLDDLKTQIAILALTILETEPLNTPTINLYKNSHNLFSTACQSGEYETAKALVERGFIDVHQLDHIGSTPLANALEAGYVDIALQLIQMNSDLHHISNDGYSILMLAAQAELQEIVQLALDAHAVVNHAAKDGETALTLACTSDDSSIASLLIEAGAKVNVKIKTGFTPLLNASSYGCKETIFLLIEKGADASQFDGDGRTALIWAVKREMREVCGKLIELNANLHHVAANGENAFLIACRLGLEEVALELFSKHADIYLTKKDNYTSLMFACQNEMEILAEVLLQRNVDIHKTGKDGEQALHYACMHKSLSKIALQLIENGADVNKMTKSGITPLLAACAHKQKEPFLLELIARTDNIEAEDSEGNSSLILLCQNGMDKPAQALLDKDADIHKKNKFGSNALIYACQSNLSEIALQMLRDGADFQTRLADGHTPFTLACKNGMVRVIERLISEGSDITKKDPDGNTFLHYACKHGLKELARQSLTNSNQQDLSQKNSDGKTPLKVLLESPLWEGEAEKMRDFLGLLLNHLGFQQNEILRLTSELEDKGITALLPTLEALLLNCVHNESAVNVLEAPFLLCNLEMGKALYKKMTNDQLENSKNSLLKSHPVQYVDQFFFDLKFNFNNEHFQKGIEVIPPKPNNVVVDELLEFFDELNIQKQQRADYFDYKKMLRQTSKERIQDLREVLREFIQKVKERTDYTGTPSDDNEREQFYQTIENALCHVIHKLKLQKNLEVTRKQKRDFIVVLLEEGELCGGKIYTTAVDLYFKIVKGKNPTLENNILSSLAEFRKILFNALVPDNEQNVHDFNFLMRKIGVELGIPGAFELSNFHDPYIGMPVKTNRAKKRFFELYTPYTAIQEWLKPKLKNEGNFREKFLAFWQQNVDDSWGKDMHNDIRMEVERLKAQNASNQELEAYLESKEVILGNDQSLDEALNEMRRHAFLSDLYENLAANSFKLNSIAEMLVKHNILVEYE